MMKCIKLIFIENFFVNLDKIKFLIYKKDVEIIDFF